MIQRFCLECGKRFETPLWRIKQGKGKYCSKRCFYIAKARNQKGKPIHSEKEKQKRRERITGSKNPMFGNYGSLNPNWKGGKTHDYPGGYIKIRMPNHPHAINGYIYEHRLIMEKRLGRYLKSYELVHHEDGNPQNNNLSNLKLLFNNSEHAKLHNLERRRNNHGQYC